MLKLSRFMRQVMMAYKNDFGHYKMSLFLANLLSGPVFRILLFVTTVAYAYKTYDLTSYIIGNALLLSAMSAIYGGGTILRNERLSGTLSVMVASPSNRILLITSKISIYMLDGLFRVTVGLIVCKLVFGADYGKINFAVFILIIVVSVFSTTGLGFLISSLGLVVRDVTLLNNTIYTVLLVMTGANYQISKLPVFLQKISMILPLTNSIQASKLLLMGQMISNVYFLLVLELLIGILYFAIGFYTFKFLEYKAVSKGELDFY